MNVHVRDRRCFVLPCICARRDVESHGGVTIADGVWRQKRDPQCLRGHSFNEIRERELHTLQLFSPPHMQACQFDAR